MKMLDRIKGDIVRATASLSKVRLATEDGTILRDAIVDDVFPVLESIVEAMEAGFDEVTEMIDDSAETGIPADVAAAITGLLKLAAEVCQSVVENEITESVKQKAQAVRIAVPAVVQSIEEMTLEDDDFDDDEEEDEEDEDEDAEIDEAEENQ